MDMTGGIRHDLQLRSPVEEDFEYVGGGDFTGAEVPFAPDPLVAYPFRTQNGSRRMHEGPDGHVPDLYADIILAKERQFELALYFVDWDGTSRRLAVELIDAATLKQIAPVRVVKDFHRGKYVVYGVDRSVRVRINTIRKPNAVLSGLFFASDDR